MRLIGPAGEDESLGKRRQKLALLALLALSRRPIPRDVLIDTFWGDQDEDRARHSLSDALSHLRRALGRNAIATRASNVTLDRRTLLEVDAIELTEAASARDTERVLALYGGPFLDGVHLDRSPRFEHWVSAERERLRTLFLEHAEAACRLYAERGDLERWRQAAERWVDAAPASSAAARNWIAALAAPDTRQALEAALAAGERWLRILAREYEMEPDATFAEQLAEYRRRAVELPVDPTPMAPVPLPRSRWRSTRFLLGTAATVALIAVGGALWWFHAPGRSPTTHPIVAVMALRNVSGDTSSAWLEDGLQQMLIADLSRVSGTGGSDALEVIDPSLLRDAARRQGVKDEAALSTDRAVQLARALGATWVVTGGVSHGQDVYVVDVTVRQVSDGRPLQVYTVTGNDILTVADRAAARIVGAADVDAKGPRLADVETGNVEAYQHFVRAIQAEQEGRYTDVDRELDAAIALDSGFVSAIVERLRVEGVFGNPVIIDRLSRLLQRAGDRVTERDRLDLAATAAEHDGEHERAESLARELVTRYPRDPRGYSLFADILKNHGKWNAADSVLEHLLALDSLAAAAGTGPCVPCSAYGGLAELRFTEGDLPGAERAARRWVALQPNLPGPWAVLGTALAFAQRYGSAMEATKRAVALGGGDPGYAMRVAEIYLLSRNYRAVDSITAQWLVSGDRALRSGAFDMRAMSEREQGRYRESNATFARMLAVDSASGAMRLVIANSLARLDERAGAVRLYQEIGAEPDITAPVSPIQPLTGDRARAFTWTRALEADAMGAIWPGEPPPDVDTVRLRVLADSIAAVSARSYYGRDWRMSHHVRGLIAMAGERYRQAIREFQQARWGAAGWTATNVALAQAYLAIGQPDSALLVVRQAYGGPLDAMGRYVPRTELDYLMALSFAREGKSDSAKVYAGYVRRAWAHADPIVKRRLAGLP